MQSQKALSSIKRLLEPPTAYLNPDISLGALKMVFDGLLHGQ